MDSGRWREVRATFDEVVELPPGARADRLAALGAADPELRQAVEALLAADPDAEQRLSGLIFGLRTPADPLGLAGRTLSHFRVLELMGTGGMGVVYSAEDTRLNRPVALKLPLPQLYPDSSARTRFLHEARSVGGLDHPNLCGIYEVGETEDGLLFLAMPLYPGETLKARLAREGRLAIGDALEIARQAALGLAAAHQAGIVHRDLKPGNLMLLPDGTVKVLDFGLAKGRDHSVTGPARLLGTAAYMAPEQVRGEPVDGRADLWALGVVLYEMTTGAQPFQGESEISIAHAIVHQAPAGPAELRGEIPAAVEDLILTLLAKDPARRYPAAEAVAADLAAIQLGRRISTRRRTRRRGAVAAAVLGFLVLGAAGGLWIRAHPGSVRARLPPGSVSHVLWVDDNPENNAEVVRQLRSHGVEVTTAVSTTDALRRYDSTVHQLVISDMGRYEGADNAYAGRAGLDLLSRLRAGRVKVPFVFCTTQRAATVYRVEALSLGALALLDDCSKVARLIGF